MARKASRRVAASKGRKAPARKSKKPAAKRVSVERFVRCIRTLHDLGLVGVFVRSAKRSKLTLTMGTAALEEVKETVNKRREPGRASATLTARRRARSSGDPFDFGSGGGGGGLGGVRPLPGNDPFDF